MTQSTWPWTTTKWMGGKTDRHMHIILLHNDNTKCHNTKCNINSRLQSAFQNWKMGEKEICKKWMESVICTSVCIGSWLSFCNEEEETACIDVIITSSPNPVSKGQQADVICHSPALSCAWAYSVWHRPEDMHTGNILIQKFWSCLVKTTNQN